jgi:hypothetical protein
MDEKEIKDFVENFKGMSWDDLNAWPVWIWRTLNLP